MKIADYEIVDHGLDYPDYFQGCGCAYTPFDNVVTGIGMNPAEAFDDCLEQIAWGENVDEGEVEKLEKRILKDLHKKTFPKRPRARIKNQDEYYHLSIRYNLEHTGPIEIEDTECHTWFERDRAHVELRNKHTDETILEFWDEAVGETVEMGFINSQDWHGSMYEYAKHLGMID